MLLNMFGVTVNVAFGRDADQSSTYSTATASMAVDNDLATVSCTNMATLTPWWSVDLGSQMYVYRVQVTNDANSYYCKLCQAWNCIVRALYTVGHKKHTKNFYHNFYNT